MKLTDLKPQLEGTVSEGVLTFKCPLHRHKQRVPLGAAPPAWQASGEFPDNLSVSPSINAKCGFHMTLTKGVFE